MIPDHHAIIESTDKAREEFGECYGAFDIVLTKEDVLGLHEGKTIAAKINHNEYSVFIRLK